MTTNKNSTRYYSTKQEKVVAEALGGTRTPNSGATDFYGKGDVHIPGFLAVECKTKMTPSTSISIKKEWFEKLRNDAVFDGIPHTALAFNFGPGEENHYIIDEYLFQDLLNYLKSIEKE